MLDLTDPENPAVTATAALIPLVLNIDEAGAVESITAIAKAIRTRGAAPFLEGTIRRKRVSAFIDLVFTGPTWTVHAAQHDLGQDYHPTVIFPYAYEGGAFSLKAKGDLTAYADWAKRAAALLMFQQEE